MLVWRFSTKLTRDNSGCPGGIMGGYLLEKVVNEIPRRYDNGVQIPVDF